MKQKPTMLFKVNCAFEMIFKKEFLIFSSQLIPIFVHISITIYVKIYTVHFQRI